MRFSLTQLLTAVALVGIGTGLLVWSAFWGTVLIFAMAAIVLWFLGTVQGSTSLRIGATIALLIAVGQVVVAASTKTCWVGSVELPVEVSVIEPSAFVPVSNARTEVLNGPCSPWEGPITDTALTEFTPVEHLAKMPIITHDGGRSSFKCRFIAAGSEHLFGNSGYIDTNGIWIRVSAPNYATVILPLDRQSMPPRDIEDRTPLLVTVSLPKIE